jgi:hypothetical protein
LVPSRGEHRRLPAARAARRDHHPEDGAPITAIPPRLPYLRRLVGALIGTMMLMLARQRGHTGGGDAMPLGEYFGKMRAGQVSPATPAGQWQFRLALLTETGGR